MTLPRLFCVLMSGASNVNQAAESFSAKPLPRSHANYWLNTAMSPQSLSAGLSAPIAAPASVQSFSEKALHLLWFCQKLPARIQPLLHRNLSVEAGSASPPRI